MATNLMNVDSFGNLIRVPSWDVFDNLFNDFQVWPAQRTMMAEPRIKMDVLDNDTSYQIKAEIPGVKKEDIKVSVDGNVVSISAEIKKEKEEMEGNTVIRSERYYGQQSRSFTLANEVDENKAAAKYHDGILELTLPKKAGGSGVKQISISE